MLETDTEQIRKDRKAHIDRLNNSYWLAHRVYQSNAKVVYSDVYSLPTELGEFDVATVGSVLLHVRDPFLALQNILRLTKETVIITDILPWYYRVLNILPPRSARVGGIRRPILSLLHNLNQRPRMLFHTPDLRSQLLTKRGGDYSATYDEALHRCLRF